MILDHLSLGERSLGDFVDLLGISEARVHRHLAELLDQGIVAARRDGDAVFYSLVDPRVVLACDVVHDFLADRMKDSRAFASHFPRVRRLRAIKPASSSVVEEIVRGIRVEGTDGYNN
jgi:ArsR family transcriptional regulator